MCVSVWACVLALILSTCGLPSSSLLSPPTPSLLPSCLSSSAPQTWSAHYPRRPPERGALGGFSAFWSSSFSPLLSLGVALSGKLSSGLTPLTALSVPATLTGSLFHQLNCFCPLSLLPSWMWLVRYISLPPPILSTNQLPCPRPTVPPVSPL